MLQSIREHSRGWVAWAIVILISIPFALWGIHSYYGGGADPVVASVNGVEITRREFDRQYHGTRLMLREQLGASYSPDLFPENQLRTEVLESMIREALLLTTSKSLGLRASDQEIRLAIVTNPAFHVGGRFDRDTYERALATRGLIPVQYEEQLRQRLVGTQLERAVFSSEFVTDRELREALRLLGQEREVAFVRVPAADLLDDAQVDDAEIQAYYQANESLFATPEMVKVEYLLLDEEAIAAAAPPDEEDLRRLYEAEAHRLSEPERRQMRHILVTVPDAAADSEALETINAARDRILAGEDFGAVAKEVSDDPGSRAEGGNLGEMRPGLLDPDFEAVAFSLDEGTLSAPVRTSFGYHLIQVDRIIPAQTPSFEEVRDELAESAARRHFEALFYDWGERLGTLTFEAGDTLAPAAEDLGLEIQTSDWIPRTGTEGVLGSPRVLSAAFSDEVLRRGLNSDLIEPQRGVLQAIVLRAIDHRDASVRPLVEVRDDIVEALHIERAERQARELASAMLEQLRAGGAGLDDVAGGWPVEAPRLVTRRDAALPDAVRTLAFDLPRPQPDRPSFGMASLAGGDVVVVAVYDVVEEAVDDLPDPMRHREAETLTNLIAQSYFEEMLDDMAVRAKIERKLTLASGED